MSKYCLYHFSLRKLPGLFFMCLFLNGSLVAQDSIDDAYKVFVKSFVAEKNTLFNHIDQKLSPYKADTTKMRYLIEKSATENYPEAQSYALNMLGIYYRNISNYDEAIGLHLDALNQAKRCGNINLEVISYNMLGVVYRRLDLIRTALDYHKQALDLAESAPNPNEDLKASIAVSQNSMGNIYLALKQFDMALNLFQKSVLIENELNNKLGLAINHQNIGYALEEKGKLDEALHNYNTSLSYNEEINSKVGKVICYNSIGKIYIKKGQYDKAFSLIEQAMKMALELGDQFYIATSYNNLGWVQLNMTQLEDAQNNLNQALKIAQEYNLKSSEIEAFAHLSELHSKKQNYKLAFEYYKKSQNLDKILTNDRNIQYVNDLILKYESEKKNNQIKALASENEIVKLKLSQSKKLYLFGLGSLLLLIAILYILYRQRKLKDEKKIITLEQDMLRNQMNPHFIFNALNSIKLYIVNNEKENAVFYLNKFSKLIRKTLVASTEKDISLKEELETMSLYMNIENIRFSNEINYTVSVDKTIDTSLVKVPSLILQPFLENAIWHGLSTKKGQKNITLKVENKHPGFVTIKITDNGVGRKVSAEIKSKKSLNRKSVGIALTKERLENFSKHFTANYKLEIIDLYNDNVPIGTQVVLKIPTTKTVLKTA